MRFLILMAAIGCLALGACGGVVDETSQEVVGLFLLDNEAFETVLLDGMREKMGDREIPEDMLAGFRTMAQNARVTATLTADGRYAVTGMMAGDSFAESGTYKVEGDIVKFTRLKRDDEHDIGTFEGTIENGDTLVVKPDPKMPAPLRLKRRV